MPSSILIDAGPLIALFDRDDKYHSWGRETSISQLYEDIAGIAAPRVATAVIK
jgi:hypothetical protein